jgi:aromatic ring-opening dioxygenase LigB subunit
MPMDYGTLVPLWFITKYTRKKPKVVIVTPSREIPLSQNYEFGRLAAELAQERRNRYVFVASADQAHAHKKSGPYGFSKAAAKYDRFVLDAIRENRIRSIMNLKRKFVKDAKPDSLWQMTMLAGVLNNVPMEAELFSYEVPTYYGMACAGFQRMN